MEFKVEYQAGQSRESQKGVDYMLADVDGIELYAEMENPTWDEEKQCFTDESATYDGLKDAILRQANEKGISPRTLVFAYDD